MLRVASSCQFRSLMSSAFLRVRAGSAMDILGDHYEGGESGPLLDPRDRTPSPRRRSATPTPDQVRGRLPDQFRGRLPDQVRGRLFSLWGSGKVSVYGATIASGLVRRRFTISRLSAPR